MKTYEQMTADVLHRAQIYACRQKRNRKIIACVCSLGCVVLLLAINVLTYTYRETGENPTLEQPTVQFSSRPNEETRATQGAQPQASEPVGNSQPPASKPDGNSQQDYGVVLLVATSSNDPGTELVENLTLPMNYLLRVRDLRGLSEAERDIIINEERKFCNSQSNSSLLEAGVRYTHNMPRENYVISFIRTGCFRLKIEDYEQVESISIKCTTKYGMVDVRSSNYPWPKGWDVEIQPEDISDYYLERPLEINWKYTTELLYALDEDPTMPLSSFSDIVTFTVKFLDGTVKETMVQIMIQDDGQFVVSMLLQTDVA